MTQITLLLSQQHNADLHHEAAMGKLAGDNRKPGIITRLAERWERYSTDDRNPDHGTPDLNRRLHRAGF